MDAVPLNAVADISHVILLMIGPQLVQFTLGFVSLQLCVAQQLGLVELFLNN